MLTDAIYLHDKSLTSHYIFQKGSRNMNKQKKSKQPPVLGRLLEYAGGYQKLSLLGCGLSGVSAAIGIFPYVFVWYAARGYSHSGGWCPGRACPLWLVRLDRGNPECRKLLCRAHVRTLRLSVWQRICEKWRLPTWWSCLWGILTPISQGRLRKQIDDNAAMTETLLAHHSRRGGGIVTPVLAVGLLLSLTGAWGLLV